MARVVFLLLVLVNLVAFVWAAGYLGGGDAGREPERLRQQLDPERLKVSLGDTPPDTVPGACRLVGPLAMADAEALEKAVVGEGGGVVVKPGEETSYWVYIPAVSGQPAERDVAALKKAGFKEFYVVTEEGPNRNDVSLGIFSREEGAKEKLARVVRNGIKSAKIAVRTKPTGQATLLVRGAPEMLDRMLVDRQVEPVDCPPE